MRPIYPADLDCVTRALMACDGPHRDDLARRIIAQARIADSYRNRLGRLHPKFGSGTLSSAALAYPIRAAHRACDAEYRSCLSKLLTALVIAQNHHKM